MIDFIPSSCSPGPTDNDGLWTSWLVAAEALRYKVTNDRVAWTNAWKYYRGMKFLVDVTGINGLPARSVVNINISNVDDDGSGMGEEPTMLPSNNNYSNISNVSNNWHSSNTCPGWIWKGDTSSDEVSILCTCTCMHTQSLALVFLLYYISSLYCLFVCFFYHYRLLVIYLLILLHMIYWLEHH